MPKEIIDALTNENFVIFAGAGVSMQPPENLGSFEDLTKSIFNEVDVIHKVKADEEKPCETRLEMLVDAYGAKVYDTCARLMGKNKPSVLHKNILKCFGSHPIRIVTTNFDEKFERAADDLKIAPQSMDGIYYGPALPLGDQFRGLVHLHGSVRSPDQMILTASDFGKAYVSKAWASRFLVDLFSTYTVLFVGYSLNDILVRYLARSISPESKNHLFVLAKQGASTEEIKSLGITPVPFREFEDLPVIFDSLARRISYSLYEKLMIVKEVADQPDKCSPAAWNDTVEFLSDPSENVRGAIAKAYADSACGFEAVHALAEHGMDSFLFENTSSNRDSTLAWWCAKSFGLTEPLSLLWLESEQNRPFSSAFMVQILHALGNPPDGLDSTIYEKSLALWALKLNLLNPDHQSAGINIAEILTKCTSPRVCISYMRKLFEARPQVNSGYLDKDSKRLELVFTYDNTLPELSFYEDSVIKQLRSESMQGFPTLVSIFEEYYDTLSAYETIEQPADYFCFFRAAIEEHSQNHKTQNPVLNSQIDLARDIGLNVLSTDSADSAIQLCLDARSNLAKRIGIFLLSQYENANPSNAIAAVISRKLLGNIALRHETFELLYKTYPKADEEHQSELIEYVLTEYPDLNNRSDAYGRFNLFSWLEKAAPSDKQLRAQLSKIRSVFPNFMTRDYPDLLSYTTSSWGYEPYEKLSESDFTARNILIKYSAIKESGKKFQMDNLFDALHYAVANYPSRSISVIEEISTEANAPLELLESMVGSIRWDKFDSARNIFQRALKLVLRFSNRKELFLSALNSISYLISGNTVNHDSLVMYYLRILDVCAKHWDWLRERCDNGQAEELGNHCDWFNSYLNSTAFVPLSLYLIASDTPQFQNNLKQFRQQTSSFVQKIAREINDDTCFGKCLCAGIGFSLRAWVDIQPEHLLSNYHAILAADNYNAVAAWDGISHAISLSLNSWCYVKDSLLIWIQQQQKSTRTTRLVAMLTRGTVSFESASERKRIINICAHCSPLIATACLQSITEWMNSLSSAEQQSELDEWLGELLPHFAEEPQFWKCGAVFSSWLESGSALNMHAIKILSEHYDEKCEQLSFPQVDLMQLKLKDDLLAKILIFYIKNTNNYALPGMHITESIQQIDPSRVNPSLFNCLRDQALQQQLELPAEWNC